MPTWISLLPAPRPTHHQITEKRRKENQIHWSPLASASASASVSVSVCVTIDIQRKEINKFSHLIWLPIEVRNIHVPATYPRAHVCAMLVAHVLRMPYSVYKRRVGSHSLDHHSLNWMWWLSWLLFIDRCPMLANKSGRYFRRCNTHTLTLRTRVISIATHIIPSAAVTHTQEDWQNGLGVRHSFAGV